MDSLSATYTETFRRNAILSAKVARVVQKPVKTNHLSVLEERHETVCHRTR